MRNTSYSLLIHTQTSMRCYGCDAKLETNRMPAVTMHGRYSDVWSTLITLAFGDRTVNIFYFSSATVKQNPVMRSLSEAVRQSQPASRRADNELD